MSTKRGQTSNKVHKRTYTLKFLKLSRHWIKTVENQNHAHRCAWQCGSPLVSPGRPQWRQCAWRTFSPLPVNESHIWQVTFSYCGVHDIQNFPDRTCWMGPNPDVTSSILAWHWPLSGMLVSLFSWPSDRKPSLFRVLTAEPNPIGQDVLKCFANKKQKM